MGNKKTGSPLIQMMIYAWSEDKSSPNIDAEIVSFFIKNKVVLSRVIRAPLYINSSALELAIVFERIDVAEIIIKEGNVDPLLCGDGIVSPVLMEYANFGTNNFLIWVLNNYRNKTQLTGHRVLDTGILFGPKLERKFEKVFGKSPVHAFLLSAHQEIITELLGARPDLLEVKDPFGRSALHLAAEEGDLESVKILLSL